MPKLKKQFGKRLKKLRKKNDLTQQELAFRIDISIDFLSLIERGESAPSFKNLEKIAEALGVEVKDLFDFS